MSLLSRFFRFPSHLRRRARRRRMSTLACMALIALVVIIPFYIVYKPPASLIGYFGRRWPDVLFEVDTGGRKVVALTIDDAPSEYTEKILGVLNGYDTTATFFVIGGQVAGREEMLADVVRSGSELGNHAMHDEPSRALSDDELTFQIETVREKIRAAYDAGDREMPPQYFRPGSGFFHERMRKLAEHLGFRIVLGGVYPHDPQISWSWLNGRHILSMVRPGAIIVCHDRRSWTAPMLRQVLPELRRRGYQIVTVTELLRIAEQEKELDAELARQKTLEQQQQQT